MRDSSKKKSGAKHGGIRPGKGIGEDLAKLRRKMRLTQEEWARIIGAHRSQVALWEGGSSAPSPERLAAMANKATTMEIAWGFLSHIGLDPAMLRRLMATGANLEEGAKSGESEEYSTRQILDVPVIEQLAWGPGKTSETLRIVADLYDHPDRIVAVKFRRRDFASIFRDGDSILVDRSTRPLAALQGRLVVVAFDPFPVSFELTSPSEQVWQRIRGSKTIDFDPEVMKKPLSPKVEEMAAEIYRRRTSAGYLAGWICVHYASRLDASRRPASDPWRLVLQLDSNDLYAGAAQWLSEWQTSDDPEKTDIALKSVELRREAQIVGTIVGWIASKAESSLLSADADKRREPRKR